MAGSSHEEVQATDSGEPLENSETLGTGEPSEAIQRPSINEPSDEASVACHSPHPPTGLGEPGDTSSDQDVVAEPPKPSFTGPENNPEYQRLRGIQLEIAGKMLALDCGTTDPAKTAASLALYPKRYIDISNDECQVICYHHGSEGGGWYAYFFLWPRAVVRTAWLTRLFYRLERLKDEKATLENENSELVAENRNLKAENRNLRAEKDRLETRAKADASDKLSLRSKLAMSNLNKWLVDGMRDLEAPAHDVLQALRCTVEWYEESEEAEKTEQAEKAERAWLAKLGKKVELAEQEEQEEQAKGEEHIQPGSSSQDAASAVLQPAPDSPKPALEPREVSEMPEPADAPGPSAPGSTKRNGDHEGGAVANKRPKTAGESTGQRKPELPGAFGSIGLADIGHLFDLTRKVVPEIAWTQVLEMKPMPRGFRWPERSNQMWILRCPFHLDRKPCPLSGNTGWYDIPPTGGWDFGVNHLCAEHQYPYLDLKTLIERHGTRIIPNSFYYRMLPPNFAAKVEEETNDEDAKADRIQRAKDIAVQARVFRKKFRGD
ncbi:hypothetical protein RB596_000820 [Gaeumannomyces avenae]